MFYSTAPPKHAGVTPSTLALLSISPRLLHLPRRAEPALYRDDGRVLSWGAKAFAFSESRAMSLVAKIVP
jgi:hypothetical protein